MINNIRPTPDNIDIINVYKFMKINNIWLDTKTEPYKKFKRIVKN